MCPMPRRVVRHAAGSRSKRFRQRQVGGTLESPVSREQRRDPRKKLRVAVLPPQLGIRREIRAEIHEKFLHRSVRRHCRESPSTQFQGDRRSQHQLHERISAPQAEEQPIAPRFPIEHPQGRQALEFLLHRGQRKTCAAGEFAQMDARIRGRAQRLQEAASCRADQRVNGFSRSRHASIVSKYDTLCRNLVFPGYAGTQKQRPPGDSRGPEKEMDMDASPFSRWLEGG